jgi:hypothetical protein
VRQPTTDARKRTWKWTENGVRKGSVHVNFSRDIHYLDRVGEWQDFDSRWETVGSVIRVAGVAYDCVLDGLGYRFVSHDDITYDVRIDKIGGATAPAATAEIDLNPLEGRVHANRVIWRDVVPNLDIVLIAHDQHVACWKVMKSPTAPRSFESVIVADTDRKLNVDSFGEPGWDNLHRTAPTRSAERATGKPESEWDPAARGALNIHRFLRGVSYEIVEEARTGGKVTLRTSTAWNGTVREIDPHTRQMRTTTNVHDPAGLRV